MSGPFEGHLPWTMAVLFSAGDHEPHGRSFHTEPLIRTSKLILVQLDDGFNGTRTGLPAVEDKIY
jgi:hypothetical protein